MHLSLITPPAAPLLSISEAKEHLRVDTNTDDVLISAYVEAVNDMLDAKWGELGRALVTQTWAAKLNGFPYGDIVLPIAPVQIVTSIKYQDANDTEQTVASANYRLINRSEYAFIELASGASWPQTLNQTDVVTITFDAGYGASAMDVPEGIRMAARLMVAHWYENREAVTEKSMAEMPMGIRALLMKYRVSRGHI